MRNTKAKSSSTSLPYRYRRYPPLAVWLGRVGSRRRDSERVRQRVRSTFAVLRGRSGSVTAVRRGTDPHSGRELDLCRFLMKSARTFNPFLTSSPRCPASQHQAAGIVGKLSPMVTVDELFVAAWKALSYFRARVRK